MATRLGAWGIAQFQTPSSRISCPVRASLSLGPSPCNHRRLQSCRRLCDSRCRRNSLKGSETTNENYDVANKITINNWDLPVHNQVSSLSLQMKLVLSSVMLCIYPTSIVSGVWGATPITVEELGKNYHAKSFDILVWPHIGTVRIILVPG